MMSHAIVPDESLGSIHPLFIMVIEPDSVPLPIEKRCVAIFPVNASLMTISISTC